MNVHVGQLRAAIQDCSERRLGETAKWYDNWDHALPSELPARLSELLLGLPAEQRRATVPSVSTTFQHSTPARTRNSDSFQLGGLVPSASDVAILETEQDLLARLELPKMAQVRQKWIESLLICR